MCQVGILYGVLSLMKNISLHRTGTHSLPSKSCDSYNVNDINGFHQHNNSRQETITWVNRVRCCSLQRQLKQKPCIKMFGQRNSMDPVTGALEAVPICGLYFYICLCDPYSKARNDLFSGASGLMYSTSLHSNTFWKTVYICYLPVASTE
jgi:hypothetical protein